MSEMKELFQKEVSGPLGMELTFSGWDDYLYKSKVGDYVEGKSTKRKWSTGVPTKWFPPPVKDEFVSCVPEQSVSEQLVFFK